jgi:hypothetical protein
MDQFAIRDIVAVPEQRRQRPCASGMPRLRAAGLHSVVFVAKALGFEGDEVTTAGLGDQIRQAELRVQNLPRSTPIDSTLDPAFTGQAWDGSCAKLFAVRVSVLVRERVAGRLERRA